MGCGYRPIPQRGYIQASVRHVPKFAVIFARNSTETDRRRVLGQELAEGGKPSSILMSSLKATRRTERFHCRLETQGKRLVFESNHVFP